MQVLQETTLWKTAIPNHTYLLDGTNLVAYIKQGSTDPFYFKNPIKSFDKKGRTFLNVKVSPFDVKIKSNTIQVTGSKGQIYTVDPDAKTCSCTGYGFRGVCKHLVAIK